MVKLDFKELMVYYLKNGSLELMYSYLSSDDYFVWYGMVTYSMMPLLT